MKNEPYQLPINLHPSEYPYQYDRLSRMFMAVMVNSVTDPAEKEAALKMEIQRLGAKL